jgi:hypothetical protein
MGFKIIDNFLSDFDSLRDYCDQVNYDGVTNPADNVFYDGVTLDIPDAVQKEVIQNLTEVMGRKVTLNSIFMRLSKQFAPYPHQAHTDKLMGNFSLMLYLNRLEDCEGGTSLVIHKEGLINSTPINDKQFKVWERDVNTPDAWQITDISQMIPNRACIFDANLMHRAEPIGGFGDSPKNARLVLTAFYD